MKQKFQNKADPKLKNDKPLFKPPKCQFETWDEFEKSVQKDEFYPDPHEDILDFEKVLTKRYSEK